ncbi:MAG: tetratricopeptide repeat protein [Lewinellaceae bacterium]|nr:tetratricopeptide repeat protein [Lewinellaceae bacterium]
MHKKLSLLVALISVSLLGFGQSNALRSGEKLYQKKDFSAAETQFKKAGNATGDYNAGNAAYQQGNYEAAARHFSRAATLDNAVSEKSDAFFNLGNTWMRLGQYQKAIVAYEKSLRLSPGRLDAKKNLQIAKRLLEQDDNPPPPPPPPPPPKTPPPRDYYVDKALNPRKKEEYTGPLTPEQALRLLQSIVVKQETESARQYREQVQSREPSRLKKDW